MPITQAHYTLGTAIPTKIVPAQSIPQKVFVHNAEHAQSDEVFIGNAAVSTSNGLHIHSDETLEFDLDPGSDLWAISDTVGSIVHTLVMKQD